MVGLFVVTSSTLMPCEKSDSVFIRLGKALYDAKHLGRNNVQTL